MKQAAESATAELRQSLQKEHDRAEALTSELAKAKRDIETQVALASKAGDEAAQLKQQGSCRERDGGAATVSAAGAQPGRGAGRCRESAQPPVGARIAVERASNSQIAQVKQAAQRGCDSAASGRRSAIRKRPGCWRAPARCSAREISVRRGSCSSALSRRAAHRQASCSRRHMIPSFFPHGGHTERAAM